MYSPFGGVVQVSKAPLDHTIGVRLGKRLLREHARFSGRRTEEIAIDVAGDAGPGFRVERVRRQSSSDPLNDAATVLCATLLLARIKNVLENCYIK